MSKSKIVDLHCDTIWMLRVNPGMELKDADLSINIAKLREGGSLAQSFALYIPWAREEKEPCDVLLDTYRVFQEQMEKNKDSIRLARTYDEIMANEGEGMLSAFLTCEDAAFIGDDLSRIDMVYDWGVRMIGLIWNNENTLAYPNSADREAHMLPLKPFGRLAVEKMNDMGILVDCSHLNEGGFYDVADIVKGPFVASHSCARALCDAERNLTDHQLKVLGDRGGVVGINFYCGFLNIDETPTTFDRIIDHLVYMKDKAGIEALAMGSDFDGISDNGELVDFTGFPRLVERMEKAFTYDEIDKITHLNALRVIKEVVG